MSTVSSRVTLAVACSYFLMVGLMLASIGTCLADLARAVGHDLATLGIVFTVISGSALLTQLSTGMLHDRSGPRLPLLGGVLALSIGMFSLTLAPTLALLLIAAGVAGLGFGALIVSLNLLVAQRFDTRSAQALNVLNLFFSIGAMVGPLIAGTTLRLWGSALPVLWLGAALLFGQLPLLPLLAGRYFRPAATMAAPAAAGVYRLPVVWGLGVLLLLYTGTEIGMGGWMPTYLERSADLPAATAAMATSGFWLALLSGRLLGALLSARMALLPLLGTSLVGALLGALLLRLGLGHLPLTLVAVGLIGLSFGPIFPLVIALAGVSVRQAPGAATGIVMALGNLGALVLPWLQGVLLLRIGPPASTALILGTTLTMLLLGAGFWIWHLRIGPATQPLQRLP